MQLFNITFKFNSEIFLFVSFLHTCLISNVYWRFEGKWCELWSLMHRVNHFAKTYEHLVWRLEIFHNCRWILQLNELLRPPLKRCRLAWLMRGLHNGSKISIRYAQIEGVRFSGRPIQGNSPLHIYSTHHWLQKDQRAYIISNYYNVL